jgi:hypothetical protein
VIAFVFLVICVISNTFWSQVPSTDAFHFLSRLISSDAAESVAERLARLSSSIQELQKDVTDAQKVRFLFPFSLMGVWQGVPVAMNSLKFDPGPPCPILLRPALSFYALRPYSCFRDGLPAEWASCGRLYPFGHPTPYAYVLLCALYSPSLF